MYVCSLVPVVLHIAWLSRTCRPFWRLVLQRYTLGTVSTLLACRAVMCMGSKHCGLQDTEDHLVLCVWMISMARTRLWGPLVGQLPPACWSAWQLISQEHNRNICWQGCGTPGASTQLWEIALPAHGSCGVQIYYVCAGKLGLVGYGAGSAACGFLAHLMASDSLPYSPDVQIPIVTLWSCPGAQPGAAKLPACCFSDLAWHACFSDSVPVSMYGPVATKTLACHCFSERSCCCCSGLLACAGLCTDRGLIQAPYIC